LFIQLTELILESLHLLNIGLVDDL
jgi:hypothetical protein